MEPAYVMEAFGELRLALTKLGMVIEGNEGSYPYFGALLKRNDNGAPRIGVFVSCHRGTHFSWSAERRHPITDVPGAAREIARDLLRMDRAANPGVGRHAMARVERRLGARHRAKRRRWPG
jgi:hypothetical protein